MKDRNNYSPVRDERSLTPLCARLDYNLYLAREGEGYMPKLRLRILDRLFEATQFEGIVEKFHTDNLEN